MLTDYCNLRNLHGLTKLSYMRLFQAYDPIAYNEGRKRWPIPVAWLRTAYSHALFALRSGRLTTQLIYDMAQVTWPVVSGNFKISVLAVIGAYVVECQKCRR
jgi:hypothetical protein